MAEVTRVSLQEKYAKEHHQRHIAKLHQIQQAPRKKQLRSNVKESRLRTKSMTVFKNSTKSHEKANTSNRIHHENHILLDRLLNIQGTINFKQENKTQSHSQRQNSCNKPSNFEISKKRSKMEIARENISIAERLLYYKGLHKQIKSSIKDDIKRYLSQKNLIRRYHKK